MKLARTVLAATATLGLGLAMAVPAQADHFTTATVEIKGASCFAGEISSGTFQSLFDPKAKVQVRKDGSERWLCTFRNVEDTYDEYGNLVWEVPTTTVRATMPDGCLKGGPDGEILAGGVAEITYKPNGTVTIRCDVYPSDHSH